MIRRLRFVAIVTGVIGCGVLPAGRVMAASSACTGSVVEYTASGTFGSTPLSGVDGLRLAGNPFNITLYACETKTPTQSGANYAIYSPLEFTGSVKSTLLGGGEHNIRGYSSIILSVPSSGRDSFQLYAQVNVLTSLAVQMHAILTLAPGTLKTTSIAPFGTVQLFPADTMTYSTSTGSTTLSIASGTLVSAASR